MYVYLAGYVRVSESWQLFNGNGVSVCEEWIDCRIAMLIVCIYFSNGCGDWDVQWRMGDLFTLFPHSREGSTVELDWIVGCSRLHKANTTLSGRRFILVWFSISEN